MLKQHLSGQIPLWREQMKLILEEQSGQPVDQVKVLHLYRGLRGLRAILCDTSSVDPQQGLLIRGIPVLDLVDRSAEEVFFLLVTGQFPSKTQLQDLHTQLKTRYSVPEWIWDMVRGFPRGMHPLAMLSAAVLSLQGSSQFYYQHDVAAKTDRLWELCVEDALTLLAWMPVLAAGIYRIHFLHDQPIEPDPELGIVENFARMLGLPRADESLADLLRIFYIVHSDHDGGNVAQHCARLAGSAHSDLFFSIAASMGGLAGHLHGQATQLSVQFVQKILQEFRGMPSEALLKEHVTELIKAGVRIPGYGHAVLRAPDPRFKALHSFGQAHFPDDPLFQVADRLARLVPPLLQQLKNISNPYPNIDAISGITLFHYGMERTEFYSVMFACAQAMGTFAQNIIYHALRLPIIRPSSLTTQEVLQLKHGQEE